MKLKDMFEQNGAPYVLLVAGVAGIGFSPALVKALGISGMGPSAIGFWRNLIGALFLFAIAIVRGRSLRLSPGVLKWTVLAALCFALDLNFWHRSVMYAGSGISTVIGNMQVFITSILGVMIFGDKLSPRFKLAVVAGMAGLVMLTGVLDDGVLLTPVYMKGILYALVTAFMYALYLVNTKLAGTHSTVPDPLVFMAWISLFSAAFMLVGCLYDHGNFRIETMRQLGLSVALGAIVQGLCWWMIAMSMVKIRTNVVALVLLLQPALAVLWGFLLFGEQHTIMQVIGVFLTIGAIYLGSARLEKNREPGR